MSDKDIVEEEQTVEESVLSAIKTAYDHNKRNNPGRLFTRQVYRELARELNLDFRSDDTARRLFGTWKEAMSQATAELEAREEEEILEEMPDPDEDVIPYLTKRTVPKSKKVYKILVFPDIHVPFQCKAALEAAIQLGEEFKPDEVIQLGDLLDCYSLSKFPKSRNRYVDISEEIDEGTKVLKMIKKRTGAKRCVFIEGNHEARIRKYILNKAPELGRMKAIRVDHLLDLATIGWDFIPEHKFYAVNNVHFTHGEYCTLYASKKHMDEYRETIVHGHTHRISCRFHRGLSRTVEAWEMGTLCSMDVSADYVKRANWQHAVGTVVIDGDDYWIKAHHIRDGKVEYNGKVFNGN